MVEYGAESFYHDWTPFAGNSVLDKLNVLTSFCLDHPNVVPRDHYAIFSWSSTDPASPVCPPANIFPIPVLTLAQQDFFSH